MDAPGGRWKRLLASCAVALALPLAGCGGAEDPTAAQKTPPSYQPAGGGYGGGGYGGPPTEQVQRPEDVGTWTKDDFLSAKRENDPRLGDAALTFANRNVGTEPAGEFLSELLKADDAAQSNSGGYGYGSSYGSPYGYGGGASEDNRSPGEKIIDALGKSNTRAGRDTLKQILLGKFKTSVSDQQAVSAALRTLAENEHPANQQILFAVATTPRKIRPVDAQPAAAPDNPQVGGLDNQPVTAISMQQEALGLLAPRASAEMRRRFAEAIVKSGNAADAEVAAAILSFLLEPHPDNIEAQALLYRFPQLPAETRAQLEGNFLVQSSAALRHFLGMRLPEAPADGESATASGADTTSGSGYGTSGYGQPGYGSPGYGQPAGSAYASPYGSSDSFTDGGPGSAPLPTERNLTAEQASRIAGVLWKDELAASLAQRLPKKIGEEEPGALTNDPLLLLAAMPIESARAAVARWLDRQEEEAAEALLTVGAFERVMSDPALLPLVKPLDRKKRPGLRSRRREAEQPGYGASGYGAGTTEESQAEPLEQLINRLIARLQEAGQASADSSAEENFPLTFQGESRPSIIHSATFPGSAGISGIKPAAVSVHFARIEQEERLPIVEGHYRRQMYKPMEKEAGEGIWLDSHERDRKTGKIRSIDVFIRPTGEEQDGEGTSSAYGQSGTGYGAGRTGGQDEIAERRRRRLEPQKLSVELLIVEIDAIEEPAKLSQRAFN